MSSTALLFVCLITLRAAGAPDPKSATRPDPTATVGPDSAQDSSRASDSLATASSPSPLEFRRLLADSGPGPSPRLDLNRTSLDRADAGLLREILGTAPGLARVPSGSFHLPDAVDSGDLPGREPMAVLLDGRPLTTAGHPEMPVDAPAPVWLESARVYPADPLRHPNNPTGGPILESALAVPDSLRTISAARLTSGTANTHTEEFFAARPIARGLIRVAYADQKSDGRLLFGSASGQNLLLRYERVGNSLAWAVGSHQNFARAVVYPDRRWLWDRSGWDGRVLVRGRAGTIEGTTSLDWERRAWEDSARPAKRKDALTTVLLRWTGVERAGTRSARLAPLASLEVDARRLRFYQPGVFSLDRRDIGIGFAVGLGGETNRWRYRSSIGRSSPDARAAGLSAMADVEHAGSWTHRATLSRSVRPRLLPRLSNHLWTEVAQSLVAPAVETEPPLEAITRLEWTSGAPELGRVTPRLTFRAVELRHAVSAEGGLLDHMTPDGFAFLPESAFDRTIRVWSGELAATVRLAPGLGLEASGVARASDPGWRDQFWMTPWQARARLTLRRTYFGALDTELALRGEWSGERATPFGILQLADRYDAGATATVGDVRLVFLLTNLEDDLSPAAAYDGGAMVLPLRSFRMGLVWRFVD